MQIRRLPLALSALAIGLLAPAASGQEAVNRPPMAAKKPHKTEIHGYTLVDDYFWLREKSNPEVIKHLEAENAFIARNGGDRAIALFAFRRFAGLSIEQEEAARGDRGTHVARLHRDAPSHGWAVGFEILKDAGLPPDAVALWPQPLRPVVGLQRRSGREHHQQRQDYPGHRLLSMGGTGNHVRV